MLFIPPRCAMCSFALSVFLTFAANGCGEEKKKPGGSRADEKPYCGDKMVTADPSVGAIPGAVYVCEGDTVTWAPPTPTLPGFTFSVDFKKDSPFVDDAKHFGNGNNENTKSKKTKPHQHLKVYEYKIIVNHVVFDDPQVVGGGKP